MKRILLSWSSGKDSAWSLHLLRQRVFKLPSPHFVRVIDQFRRLTRLLVDQVQPAVLLKSIQTQVLSAVGKLLTVLAEKRYFHIRFLAGAEQKFHEFFWHGFRRKAERRRHNYSAVVNGGFIAVVLLLIVLLVLMMLSGGGTTVAVLSAGGR